MRFAFPLLFAAITVSGCTNFRSQEALRDWKAASAQCNIDHPKAVGQYVARASCLNDALSEMVDAVQPTAGEAAGEFENERLQLARQVDARQLSSADYDEQTKVAFLKFRGQAAQEANQERAQRAQEAAMILASTPQPQYIAPQPYSIPTTPAQTTTNCLSTGYGVTCHSF